MEIDEKKEKQELDALFESIFDHCKGCKERDNEEKIRRAYALAYKAHKGIRRRSGEPYIIHPIEVAIIATKEIGLGTKSVIAALLHDVVEDTDYTLEDIDHLFGPKITNIIDGLTKISGIFDSESMQAENFKKMLLTLSDDVRVILIKLADRLHNMRTLGSMPQHKQYKIAGETLYMYAPLAHRLGLYKIKTELEDLSFKYKEPEQYYAIQSKILTSEKKRTSFINKFSLPIISTLTRYGLDFEITGRTKSIYSIWNKMQIKGVPFEEVYDIFAIRIVFKALVKEREKTLCWNIYSVITDNYQPNPDRLRDWVSTPKANGYEALHTTVMGPGGLWVEVQVRSNRMDEIAEKGYAAHWKYKSSRNSEGELDKWIGKIKDHLKDPNSDALEFLDEFKLNLFTSEIYVFAPDGNLRRLPKKATALDFAFDIHSEVGEKAIGAKVNFKLVPLSYILHSGDQVEILNSEKQTPKREWLEFVTTAKARSCIKNAFKDERKIAIADGIEKLDKELKNIGFKQNANTMRKIFESYEVSSKNELYCKIGRGILDLKDLKKVVNKKRKNKFIRYWGLQFSKVKPTKAVEINKKKDFVISENTEQSNYIVANCCNPIPGDDVLGYIDSNENVVIHKTNCPKALKLMSSQGDRIVNAKWKAHKILAFLATIEIKGIDKQGIIHDITGLISNDLNVNMRSISINSLDGVFNGTIDFYIHNVEDLNQMISDIKKIKGVSKVRRIEITEAS